MLEVAAPEHIPHANRRFAPIRWRWSSVVRWLFAVGEDGVLRSSRLQMETRKEHTAAGEPDPAERVDLLFQEHAHAVLAYLVYRLPTLPDAEDVLDDVFLAALHASASGQFLTRGWLLVTAQRRSADFYRKRQRQQALPLAATDVADEQHAGEQSEPEWAALRGEEHRELLRLVARLPQEQQEVLALRFAAGLQSPEIGEVIGKRADAVRALLGRAMRRLREEWTR
jgi:RNA polymerase sigma-70 factor, ECF subfamily